MISPLEFVIAVIVDLIIGDPRWLPHPVRIIGRFIASVERGLRRFLKGPVMERVASVVLVTVVGTAVFGITYIIVQILRMSVNSISPVYLLAEILLIWLVSTTLAIKELIYSARAVITAVREDRIDVARENLSMIVGRDTRSLDRKGVLKATIETLAENFSDAVVAPIFYLLLGGLPLAMLYKAVNTMDSMVGYKNERYLYFGWAAARLDDIMNYVPARISGLMILFSVALLRFFTKGGNSLSPVYAFFVMFRDGRKHPSPNSGVPEAAMAGALGVQLGGPCIYSGVKVNKPFIGNGINRDYLFAAEQALFITFCASVLTALSGAVLLWII